jgi:hypothetical protein
MEQVALPVIVDGSQQAEDEEEEGEEEAAGGAGGCRGLHMGQGGC